MDVGAEHERRIREIRERRWEVLKKYDPEAQAQSREYNLKRMNIRKVLLRARRNYQKHLEETGGIASEGFVEEEKEFDKAVEAMSSERKDLGMRKRAALQRRKAEARRNLSE
jgi:hypothetical protein